jgi:hypothetical protein
VQPFLGLHSSFCHDFAYFSTSYAKKYDYGMKFITLIQAIYDKAFCSGQINGYVPGLFTIQSSIKQGCSMSVLLFPLVLNQLLCLLAPHRRGFRIRHQAKKSAVTAYADDVIGFVMSPADIYIIGASY